MLWKQQQIKCHIIPGDTGTALQPLRNEWSVANTRSSGTEASLNPAPSPPSFHISSLLTSLSLGKGLEKGIFAVIAAGSLLENTLLVQDVHSDSTWVRFPEIIPFLTPAWLQLAANTKCKVTPACVLPAVPASPHSPSFLRFLC